MGLFYFTVFGLFALCAAFTPDGAYSSGGSQFSGVPYGNINTILKDQQQTIDNFVKRQQVQRQRVNNLVDSSSDNLALREDFIGVGRQDITDEIVQQNERFGRLRERLAIVRRNSAAVATLQQKVLALRKVENKIDSTSISTLGLVNSLAENISISQENITEAANQASGTQQRLEATYLIAEGNARSLSIQEFKTDQFITTQNFNTGQAYRIALLLKSGVANTSLTFPGFARNFGGVVNGFSIERTGKRYNYGKAGTEVVGVLLSEDFEDKIEVSGYDLSEDQWRTNAIYASILATKFLAAGFDIQFQDQQQ